MKKYKEYIKSLAHNNALDPLRKELLTQSAKIFLKHNAFDRNGMLISKNIQEFMNLGLRYSLLERYHLLELAKDNHFEHMTILNENSTEALYKIWGPDVFREVRIFFQNYKDKIDSIVKALSENTPE